MGRCCVGAQWTPSYTSAEREERPSLSLRPQVSTNTQRLARQPDSLVRVSRRVGWGTDEFVTDL